MIHTASWEEVAQLILRERGAFHESVNLVFIKDGKVNVETESAVQAVATEPAQPKRRGRPRKVVNG